MRRQIIVVFFSLFFLGASPAWAQQRGALFKVSDKGHTLYLFGTIHAGLPEFYPLEKRITDAVTGASTLALEVDVLKGQDEKPALLQRYAMRKPGGDPYAGAPAGLKARLQKVLGEAGIPLDAATTMRPWMLAMVLGLQQVAALGYRADLGADIHLGQLARGARVKVIELESAGGQLSLLYRLSDADQWRLLDETLAAIESGKAAKELRALVAAWGSADVAALDAAINELENDPSWSGKFTREVLLEQRNGPMADKLALLLARENSTVAAVGTLHLLGKRGLPAMLRERGLTVERVY